jgi:tetratricopeptide (TPR) repeat protein
LNPSRRIHGLAWLICLTLIGSGCSSAPEKPDTTNEEVAEASDPSQAQDSEGQAAAADPSDESTKAAPTKSIDAPDDNDDPAQSSETGQADGPIKISSQFKSDLSAAIDDLNSGDRASAVDRLQQLVDEPDGGFLAAYNLGVLYENEGDYQNAARRYSQALAKNRQFSPALLNLVRLYIRLGQDQDAEKLARKYTDACPENMTHRAVALQVDLHAGKYEEVIGKAKRILRRDETNVEAMLAMAEANIQLDRGELAEAILDRALELRPNRAEIYFKFAKIRANAQNITEAIAVLERALKHRNNYPEAHNNLGVLYHEAGDYNSAVQEFKAAIGDYPDFKEAYLNLGNSLKGLQKYKKAEKAFKKALEIDAKYADALFNLGVLYLDSDIEGIEQIDQLNTSIDYFTEYQSAAGSRASKGDPSAKYIAEARKAIETEKQRQQMMRQAQMQAEGETETEDDTESSEEGSDASAETE